MARYELCNLTKTAVYNIVSRYFVLDKCKWYIFKKICKGMYRLTFGDFEYTLSISFGYGHVTMYDVENRKYVARHLLTYLQLEELGVVSRVA